MGAGGFCDGCCWFVVLSDFGSTLSYCEGTPTAVIVNALRGKGYAVVVRGYDEDCGDSRTRKRGREVVDRCGAVFKIDTHDVIPHDFLFPYVDLVRVYSANLGVRVNHMWVA
jgi:hypothetical protein